ncbi:hypothetical protein CDAR_288551 [Caerostris darwini]|uniref:BTB domain-containing protein n=1 Tax=Caerostris darwini TaxID=1538125 RepID=A0AAV4TJU6_9ARAC|nr:hypothetical protein CDAR_288551 [Caerostris darwini]
MAYFEGKAGGGGVVAKVTLRTLFWCELPSTIPLFLDLSEIQMDVHSEAGQEFLFEWNIKNFSLLKLEQNRSITSTPYNIPGLGKTYLELYPKGKDFYKNDVMVYVRCANELRLSNFFGTCNIKILHVLEEELAEDDLDKELVEHYKLDKAPNKFALFYTTLVNLDRIESDRALWHLNVACSFQKIPIEAFKITFDDDPKDMRMFAIDFRKLYETKEMYDIILCTPEKSFPAHKAILGARLPKLTESLHINSEGINDLDSWTHIYKINDSSIVSSDDSDESKPESVFLDMKAETLESLLEYAYTGSISHVMTDEIVAAIDDYDIVSLSEVFCSVPDKILFDTCICVDEKIFKWKVTHVNNLFSGKKINGPQFFLGLDTGTQIAIDAVFTPSEHMLLRISRFSDEGNLPLMKCLAKIVNPKTKASKVTECRNFLPISVSKLVFTIEITYELRNLKNYFHDDFLDITFFLYTALNDKSETIVSTHHALQRIPSTEDHLLRYLCYDIARLYDVRSPKFGDITFQIGEDTLYAHKAVLGARSATFKRKFQSHTTEQIMTITNTDSVCFSKMLEFIYTGKVRFFNTDTVIDLHDAAQKYQVTSLIAKCSAHLKNSITDQNSKTIFDLAVLYSDPELEVAVAKFIRPRKVEVLDMDEWVLPSVDSRYFRMLTRLRECEEGSDE